MKKKVFLFVKKNSINKLNIEINIRLKMYLIKKVKLYILVKIFTVGNKIVKLR